MTQVILVDSYDKPIGEAEKLKVHQEGLLHRAFSVFIYRKSLYNPEKIETLLQQRHTHKYHSGGLWTNACCSHPLPGETVVKAAYRRLREEMHLKIPVIGSLETAGTFLYRASVGNGLIEHELDHVLAAEMQGSLAPIKFDPREIQAIQWCEIDVLKKAIQAYPARYTVWLAQALGTWLAFYNNKKLS